MGNLDSLRSEIKEETDLIFFDEVISCIDAEAYRAAYIMIWVSIAESIRGKMNKMSFRDSEVKRNLAELERMEEENRSIDFKLIEAAKILGYIDNEEFVQLDTIRKMRNSYAHPTGRNPSRREVTCALNTAVKLVLSKPPLLRNGYVVKTLEIIFTDPHYFDETSLIVEKHADNFVNRIHPEVLKFSIKKLLEKLDNTFEDYEQKVFRQRGVIFGQTILKSIINRDLQGNSDFNDYLDDHPISSSLIFLNSEIWANLLEQEKNRAFGYLIDQISRQEIMWCRDHILTELYNLYSSSNLTDRQENQFKSLLDSFGYATLRYSSIPLQYYAHRFIDDLESHTWEKQNNAMDAIIELPEGEIEKLTPEIQEQLGRNILQSADGRSWQASNFLSHLYQNYENYPLKFLFGVLVETLVNNDKEFRLKPRFFKKVLRIALRHPQKELIFDELIEEIENSTPKRERDEKSYQSSLDLLNEINDTDESIFNMIRVIESKRNEYFN
jgi:hypothetical protein